MNKLEKGYIQIYTGNGKGKTTAALGLAIRAVGNGLKVYMLQFLKSGESGELEIEKFLGDKFKIYRFEKKKGFFWNLNEEEKAELEREVRKAYDFAYNVMLNNDCDILILDEIMGVISNKLLSEEDILKLIQIKPCNMEVILTGRNVPEAIAEKADLITEMKDIKHYMNKGVNARQGIEY